MRHCLICILLTAVLSLTSCSGSVDITDPEEVVDVAVATAQSHKFEGYNGPFGNLPTLAEQYKIADDTISLIYKVAYDKLSKGKDFKNMSDHDIYEALEKSKEINGYKKECETLLKQRYDSLYVEAAKGLSGKSVPCGFDPEQYIDAEVHIKNIDNGNLIVECTVIPIDEISWVQWCEVDSDNEAIADCAYTINGTARADVPFTFTTEIEVNRLINIASLYFSKNN